MKILAFAGSLRQGSLNKLLLEYPVEGARRAGAEVTVIALRDFPLPLYDGDLEDASGLPENAVKLKELFRTHDGLLIASPEYNHGLSAALKNTIDWVSRRGPGEGPLVSLRGKQAGLVSASPGGFGGFDSLTQLRGILWWLKIRVIHDHLHLALADQAFDEQGRLVDEKKAEAARLVGQRLAESLRLHSQI